jgi:murein tripeptide amidase MpaA
MSKIMNITEIESALIHFETAYPQLCERIKLPEETCEGRSCHALRIGKHPSAEQLAVLIIGGVHAREWGGPDIVINFAGDLLRAYSRGKGLRYTNKAFQAGDIRTIVEERTVVIFPCANPDGVEFSQTQNQMWRKNRNPTHSGGEPKKIGVDINRNYDFLWDFKKFFHRAAWKDSLASDDPSIETFHGTSPFSEPETRNVRWLMDRFNFALFLDLHSFGGDVLYSWGDDRDQNFCPAQNFANPVFNGKRGLLDDSYREFIAATDYEVASRIALQICDAMVAVRNRPYRPTQSVGYYPTSGASDDYAFSRHIVGSSLAKTFAYTLEFNFDDFFETADPRKLDETMRDVIPGLITVCLAAWQARPLANCGQRRSGQCCFGHSNVRVTSNQSSCRRPWPTTRSAKRRSKVTVGTMNRSIAAIASA